jgi:hypothetical protein
MSCIFYFYIFLDFYSVSGHALFVLNCWGPVKTDWRAGYGPPNSRHLIHKENKILNAIYWINGHCARISSYKKMIILKIYFAAAGEKNYSNINIRKESVPLVLIENFL